MEQYMETYDEYVKVTFKLKFFNSCKGSRIIPKGLVVEKNLATHVNDELFIQDYQESLSEASSRSFDKIVEQYEYSKVKLEEKLDDLRENLDVNNGVIHQIRINFEEQNAPLKVKLANKHLAQVQQVEETKNSPFILCHGSRKVKGLNYIPPKYCQCNIKRVRPHRLKRKRGKKKAKFGPRQETLQDIIEVEQAKRDPINLTDFVLTDGMKDVLRLGASFAPTPTQPANLYGLYVDFHKWADNLRWHYFFSHKDPEAENTFVKKPWYQPSTKKAPRANDATEAFIFKVQEDLFNVEKRRKINDNLSQKQRKALKELMGLVENHGIIIRFEDKGSRFVVDSIANHDATLSADLNDANQYDKLNNNPIEDVKNWINAFADKWEKELDDFHPNVRKWLVNLEKAEPGKVKGLIKCHKPTLANGKKPYRLLLCGTNTPVQPLSKLVQDAIKHLIPKLQYKARYTKAIHQILITLNRKWQHLGGLPDTAKQVCCDVRKLYPSVDNDMGIPAVRRLLEKHPNPEGLDTDLIIDVWRKIIVNFVVNISRLILVLLWGRATVVTMQISL